MILSFFDPMEYPKLDKSGSVYMADIFKNYKNIFERVAKKYKLRTYVIQNAPRPEELSYTIYGNTQYYWLLLYANDIYDPFNGWIKPSEACYAAASKKYPDAENTIVYHVDANGEKHYNLIQYEDQYNIWFDKGDTAKLYPQHKGSLVPVTAYEDELIQNEYKRRIKIIAPGEIGSFMDDFIKELEKL